MFKDNTGKEYGILEEEVFSTPSIIFIAIKTEDIIIYKITHRLACGLSFKLF